MFTIFALKCLNFAQILENLAQSCDFMPSALRSSVWSLWNLQGTLNVGAPTPTSLHLEPPNVYTVHPSKRQVLSICSLHHFTTYGAGGACKGLQPLDPLPILHFFWSR